MPSPEHLLEWAYMKKLMRRAVETPYQVPLENDVPQAEITTYSLDENPRKVPYFKAIAILSRLRYEGH